MAEQVKNELAVKVAKDALEWLGEADVRPGSYLEGNLELPPGKAIEDLDLRDVADRVRMNCRMCIRGAALVAKARVMDKVPLSLFASARHGPPFVNASSEKIRDSLSDVFDEETEFLMEAAFEMNSYAAIGTTADRTRALRASDFGARFDGPRDRAVAVFREVVRQGGVFDPFEALRHAREADPV